jgi:hypothetical protein
LETIERELMLILRHFNRSQKSVVSSAGNTLQHHQQPHPQQQQQQNGGTIRSVASVASAASVGESLVAANGRATPQSPKSVVSRDV